MSTATIQRNQKTAYQQPVDEVLAALGTDARRGLSEGEARARLEQIRQERVDGGEARASRGGSSSRSFKMCSSSCCSSQQRFRQGCGCMSANRRCPTKRWRSSPSCCSTRSWATFRSRERSKRWRRCARCRRRTPTSFATASGRASRRLRSCPATSSSSKKATPFPPMRD